MRNHLAHFIFLALPVVGLAEPALDFGKDVRPLIEKHCFGCHGAEKGKGGVRLHEFTDTKSLFRDPKLWEKVIESMRDEAMPPDDKPQPPADERARVVDWIEHALDNPADDFVPKDPGRPFLHRLSKREYNNTVRDLLGVTSKPADDFPPDAGGGGGFDNNSATLFIPPVLVEKYLASATRMLAEARPELIFTARPGDQISNGDAARKAIEEFAARAFRRPLESGEADRFVQLYTQAESRGDPWEKAVKSALRAVLVSPSFLFRMEVPHSTEAHLVSDFEMASRLSYFLWSSMPDAELLRLAAGKKLHDPAVLDAQVQRMLRDPRARDFAENFAGQWLRVHELETSAQPDAKR
ncbi:MAG TPA: DUF1592 domain-containing protein, partial [Chthoniobacteraceae bacterium]|nr:DUF1592 domain-containing protein [Chthoniobacteraceae bacterium]